MTTQTDYADLIRRLEAETEPDRALADEILEACGWVFDSNDDGEVTAVYDVAGVQYSPLELPDPTESLDAALTLVPAHHLWWVKQGFRFQAVVWMIETDYDERYPPTGFSTNSPALALCIAAMKARAAIAKGAA